MNKHKLIIHIKVRKISMKEKQTRSKRERIYYYKSRLDKET